MSASQGSNKNQNVIKSAELRDNVYKSYADI